MHGPAPAHPRALVMSEGRRQMLFAQALILLMATLFGPAALAALALRLAFPHSWWPAVVAGLGGFVVGLQVQAPAMARFSASANVRLGRELAAKLRREELAEPAERGVLVGLSIGEERRTYYGDNAWDIGFLLFGEGWIAYYGDQAAYTLRTDQIGEVLVDPPTDGGKLVDTRVLLRWRDTACGAFGTLAFHPTEGIDRRGARQSLVRLAERLEAWRTQPPPPVVWVAPLPPMAAPKAGQAVAPAFSEPGAFWRALAIGIPLAIVASLVLAVADRAFGLRIPIYFVIPIVLVGSQALHQAWEKRRRERR